jgi:hypothetical protein
MVHTATQVSTYSCAELTFIGNKEVAQGGAVLACISPVPKQPTLLQLMVTMNQAVDTW